MVRAYSSSMTQLTLIERLDFLTRWSALIRTKTSARKIHILPLGVTQKRSMSSGTEADWYDVEPLTANTSASLPPNLDERTLASVMLAIEWRRLSDSLNNSLWASLLLRTYPSFRR